MSTKQVKDIIDVLHNRLENADAFIAAYREKTGNVIAGSLCETIPPEVALAAGITVLSIPEKYQEKLLDGVDVPGDAARWIVDNYDFVIIPSFFTRLFRRLVDSGIHVYTFQVPHGWGEESSVALHGEIARFFDEAAIMFDPLSSSEKIQESSEQYDSLRTIIRGIAAGRVDNIDVLSNRYLQVVFESALCLPIESVIVELSSLLELLSPGFVNDNRMINVMVFGGKRLNSGLLDEIESTGQLVVIEDDFCTGRRKFDISLNTQSPNIYYQLLDMYSYKPYCPVSRPVVERYELLYKLLKNYDINLVILLEDRVCEERNIHSDYLYKRLRHDGIDTVQGNDENIVIRIREYLEKYNSGVRISINVPLEE